jgi:cysteine desulfurase
MAEIFFDHISTTPVDPRVLAEMVPYFTEKYGNPSSHIHARGREALAALDRARERTAALVGAAPGDVVFTSGATESNNLALKGCAEASRSRGKHLVVSEVEHFSVLNCLNHLRPLGFEATLVPVDRNGTVSPESVEKAMRPDTVLVSVMHANAEIGTIQPVEEIGRAVHGRGALLHVDATASAGHVPVDVDRIGADLLTLSAHNFYGPKGAGALYVRPGTPILPLLDGGFQEGGRRAGTENVPAIVGMGAAAELAREEMDDRSARLRKLARSLREGIAPIPLLHFTGHPDDRLPGHVSFWVEHAEGESLLLFLNHHGVMAASGSACSSNLLGKDEEDLVASTVLAAIGVPTDICTGSVTFSLGKGNTEADVEHVVSILPGIVERLRAMSPTWLDWQKANAAKA